MAAPEHFRLWKKAKEGLDVITAISSAEDYEQFCKALDDIGPVPETCGIIGGILSNICPLLPEPKHRQVAGHYTRLVQKLRTLSPDHAEMYAMIEEDTEFVYAESILLEVSDHLVVMEEERRRDREAVMAAILNQSENEAEQGEIGEEAGTETTKPQYASVVKRTSVADDAGKTVTLVVDGEILVDGVSVERPITVEDQTEEDGEQAAENGAERVEGEPDEEEDDAKRQENMATVEKLLDSHTRRRITGAIYDIMDKIIDCDDDGIIDVIFRGTGGHRDKLLQFMRYLSRLFLAGLTALSAAEAIMKGDTQSAENIGRSFTDLFEQMKVEFERQFLRCAEWEPFRVNLRKDMERLSDQNRGKEHQDVARNIYEWIREKYDWLSFFVCVYDDIGGVDNHSFNGCWVHVCHRNNMNVVVAYAKKGTLEKEDNEERKEEIQLWLTALNQEINMKTRTKATAGLVTARDAKDAVQAYLDDVGDWRFVLCARRKKGLWASGDLWDRVVWHLSKQFSFCIILE